MTIEALKVPEAFLNLSTDFLLPNNFFTFNVERQEELLSGFAQSLSNSAARYRVQLYSIRLFQHLIDNAGSETDLKTQKALYDRAKQVLPIIILNQTDRSLLPVWEAMLIDRRKMPHNPEHKSLMKLSSINYGISGFLHLPDKNDDFTKPPLGVLPEAFIKWLNATKKSEFTNQIIYFLKFYKDRFPDSDIKDFINRIDKNTLKKRVRNIIKNRNKFLKNIEGKQQP